MTEDQALRAALAHELKTLVDESGKTYKEVYEHLGVDRKTFYNYLNGITDVKAIHERKIKSFCGKGSVKELAREQLNSWVTSIRKAFE